MNYLITLTGEVSNLDPLYRTADVIISSSRYEGYGMAIAEALAYGLPVIAANAGALSAIAPATVAICKMRKPLGHRKQFIGIN